MQLARMNNALLRCPLNTFRLQCRHRLRLTCPVRCMATSTPLHSDHRSNLSHEERTASIPRDRDSHRVTLSSIDQLSSNIRILQLKPLSKDLFRFRPGQWLDVFVPSVPKAGGFTITSAPVDANPELHQNCFLELAVQFSPRNPPAAWLWRPEPEILGETLTVRVGGTFVWPPFSAEDSSPKKVPRKVVMVAGRVGINPLISMLRHMYSNTEPSTNPDSVTFLYATKAAVQPDGRDVLFLQQLRDIAKDFAQRTQCALDVTLFVTSAHPNTPNPLPKLDESAVGLPIHHRRMNDKDLVSSLPKETRHETACYICGPKPFTDHFVDLTKNLDGMGSNSVFCEKWW